MNPVQRSFGDDGIAINLDLERLIQGLAIDRQDDNMLSGRPKHVGSERHSATSGLRGRRLAAVKQRASTAKSLSKTNVHMPSPLHQR